MDLSVITVDSKKDLKKFVMLPWKLYKGNQNWVPPLIKDMMGTIDKKANPELHGGNYELFLAFDGKKAVGRIFTAIDETLNRKKNSNMGFFSLFECIDSYDAAKLLFDTAIDWFKKRGVNYVMGPFSPAGTDSDEYKGLLVDSFDKPPVVMNSYNPPYYQDLIERYGFKKNLDLFAYYLDSRRIFSKNPEKALEYAQKKYNYRVDTIDLNDVEKEVKAIKQVLDLAIPDEWPDMIAPSLDDVREMAKKLTPVADPDIIIIARSGDKPIGFGIALPDYNQVLIHLNGRLTPLAALKYLWYKRKINLARFFVMFVIPEFRKKGVSYAIYYQTFLNGTRKGYIFGEGSTIGETNTRMRNDIENFGGQRYKTYRLYELDII